MTVRGPSRAGRPCRQGRTITKARPPPPPPRARKPPLLERVVCPGPTPHAHAIPHHTISPSPRPPTTSPARARLCPGVPLTAPLPALRSNPTAHCHTRPLHTSPHHLCAPVPPAGSRRRTPRGRGRRSAAPACPPPRAASPTLRGGAVRQQAAM